jgi:hypothetical protein
LIAQLFNFSLTHAQRRHQMMSDVSCLTSDF